MSALWIEAVVGLRLACAILFMLACGVTGCVPPSRTPSTPRTGMSFVAAAVRPWPTPSSSTRLAFTTRSATRVSIYENALVALLLEQKGDHAGAGRILEALTALQRRDGSLPFSFDAARPREADPYIRSGAIAWVGFAAVAYLNADRSGPARDAIARMAHESARYLMDHQVEDLPDPRGGLVTGGSGTFVYRLEHGVIRQYFVERPLEWASTEHNVDAFFFLRALARMSGQETYALAAERIRTALSTKLWNAELGQFARGVSRTGRDDALALDCASWGALFLLATDDDVRASTALAIAEKRYGTRDDERRVRGHKPYAAGPLIEDEQVAAANGFAGHTWESVEAVWPEGSAGLALAVLRSGDRKRARAIVDALEPLRDADGGLPTSTFEVPFELDAQPSLAGTVWVELVREELAHPERAKQVWPR